MWGKFFDSTFTGSMFGAGIYVHAVWGYVIANTNKDHTVELNPALIAAAFGCDVDGVASAIEFLCGPDPSSRSKKEDGRRLVRRGQFVYFVVNHEDYRNVRNDEERREQNRLAQIKHRRSASDVSPERPASARVSPCHPVKSALSAHTDTDTDTENYPCAEPPAEPALPADDPVFLTFPCSGAGPKTFDLRESKVLQYEASYPAVAVRQELRSLWQWSEDNPSKRKTCGGMKRFFSNNLSRKQDSGPRQGFQLAPAAPRVPDRIELLAAEDTAHRNEPGFAAYKRAVLDGEAEPNTWDEFQKARTM